MEVRVRRATETKARHLTNARITDCDTVLATLHEWGFGGDDAERDVTGGFMLGEEDQGCWFEIVINDNDDDDD